TLPVPRRQRPINELSPAAVIGPVLLCIVWCAITARVEAQTPTAAGSANNQAVDQNRVTCESQPGMRQHCPADMSAGVTLARSTGTAPCLLGKTWGYDDTGVWVFDGCSGEFIAGPPSKDQAKTKPLEHIPNLGFLLYNGDKGQIYFRLF